MLPLNQMGSKLAMLSGNGFKTCYAPRRMGSGIELRRNNIRWKKVLGSGSELGGVRVWRAGLFFKHTLELRFERKIFMIFIVDYINQKGFLKFKII